MSKPFSRTFRVRWSETNALGQVHLSGYLRYLIETAWDWGAAGGLSIDKSAALGIAWVIRETEINIYRPLVYNEMFEFTIWLLKWRRVRGTRCFELRLKDSHEIVAQGAQQVATLDSKTLRPVRMPEQMLDNFLIENPRVIQQRKFPKFQSRPETSFVAQRDVEWRDLDALEHVNNATYAAFAEHAATQALASMGWSPSQFKTQGLAVAYRRFHIQYQAPALWGDTLNVALYLMELNPTGGTWHIEIKRASDNASIVQCVIEWSLANRVSGEEQTLPMGLFRALGKTIEVNNHS
ncbi:MAG: acyl-CoA thioesterase [Anaerolineaceae bacterium]|nr:MAG: acyl-CoA thioesterase [Anaerolineaceae bacterium]